MLLLRALLVHLQLLLLQLRVKLLLWRTLTRNAARWVLYVLFKWWLRPGS